MLGPALFALTLLAVGPDMDLTNSSAPSRMLHMSWDGLELPIMTFNRSLSGSWANNTGQRLVIAHQAGSAVANFTFGWDEPSTGLQTVTIHAKIEDRGQRPSPDDFLASGNSSASFSMVHPEYGRCRVSGVTMFLGGTLVGQFGGRKIHMDGYSSLVLKADCGGDGPTLISANLGGVWQ